MATEERLISPDAFWDNLDLAPSEWVKASTIKAILDDTPAVCALVLPYHPRPILKDRNPYNTDVYCPECGTNLSGYYGDEPLPIVTCFNCGEILDPCKATTGTDGERKDNGED